jgi:TctA family transporter
MLPFTFGMDTVPAFALLLGMYAVTATSDSISAIMFGIPGTVASQATILDGYPLAKKGQAGRAFGAAYTVSAFGGVVGAVLLAVSLPVILPFINAFGVPEFFMLSVLGLTMVGVLSGRSLLKGITVACFGLLLTTVGYADSTGVPRFYFGIDTRHLGAGALGRLDDLAGRLIEQLVIVCLEADADARGRGHRSPRSRA